MDQSLAAYLEKITLFGGLAPEELAALAQAARVVSFAAGTFLFHQGDPATTCYVLIAGRIRMTQVTPEGNQVIMRFFGPGDEFAFGAIIGRIPYPLSAEAIEPCRALAWDAASMYDLMGRFPRLALNAVNLLVEQIHELQNRLRELATERVERRIAHALLRLGRQAGRRTAAGLLIEMDLSRQDLAEMTGTTLYTVSRVLSQWESQGLVYTGRERVVLKDAESLRAIAEDLPPAAAT